MTAEVFAPAKVNLTLHITGQRADGYHLLDSLVVFADIGDRLWLTPGARMRITVEGPFADGVPTDAGNLVWRAAQAAGWTGHIRLQKNLPHGAGIGGGSSDAAAVLRHLGAGEHALSLGADVPVCLSPAPQRMQGIGEALTPAPALPPMQILLVNSGAHVPTGPVFTGLARKDNPPMGDLPVGADFAGFIDWLGAQRNDLAPPAQALAPQIAQTLGALEGAPFARMSGSGATCFALFETGAEAHAHRLQKAHPDWWIAAGEVLSG
ncbi:4-(cytidine 5'-diphospho)-2-C-methyl-D-erythritol kinase [Sulfitobacter albidus]|uniref:4-diphosphocytidyl-2-C-methyl-D-erythritol kinase n=1 Tax=Sulfitobacter albidus TaxID=2829501 RepID=A0A975JC68_9RHOB|nr:4-(cytidine 5'-diphospho)-2-C-methyl-D-erythritol kinase [Sulfitobacter albidus]QUJ75565.1 4-(cytidine 5'-diphospho)-2-C-methyl-D-erythritol kinase [Sulfitobacter albidus]